MNKRWGDRQPSSAGREKRTEKLSVTELARFLKRLSTFYRDPKTGNPLLSDALTELAEALGQQRHATIREGAAEFLAPRQRPRPIELNELRNLSPEEVEKVVLDDARSKGELIDLGIARFGISRSRLVKMNKADVVVAIRSALRHQESLRIISQEAQRGGNTRSS